MGTIVSVNSADSGSSAGKPKMSEKKKKQMEELKAQMKALDDLLAGKKTECVSKASEKSTIIAASTQTFIPTRRRASMGSITSIGSATSLSPSRSADKTPTMPTRRPDSLKKIMLDGEDVQEDDKKEAQPVSPAEAYADLMNCY